MALEKAEGHPLKERKEVRNDTRLYTRLVLTVLSESAAFAAEGLVQVLHVRFLVKMLSPTATTR